MILGLPESTFLAIHVILSLVGIASGLIVVFIMAGGGKSNLLTAIFLATTVLTSATGFPIPPFGFDPPRAVGVISLAALAIAVPAFYVFGLRGLWRWLYIITATFALYLNSFVGVIQAFQKLAFLQPLAPTQSEPPFLIAQAALAGAMVILTILSLMRFHPR
jgi:hypothetical protein